MALSSAHRTRELKTFWKSVRIELSTLAALYPCTIFTLSLRQWASLSRSITYMAPNPQVAGRSHATSRLGVSQSGKINKHIGRPWLPRAATKREVDL